MGACSAWLRAERYEWSGERIAAHGGFEEYNPFEFASEIYSDFYKLLERVTVYRDTLFYLQGYQLGKEKRNNAYSFVRLEQALSDFKAEYLSFATKWGLLGVGFSRVVWFARSVTKESGETVYSTDIQRLFLREVSPEQIKEKRVQWEIHSPDALPEPGGEILVSEWEKDYISLRSSSYSESYNSVIHSCDLLAIRDDNEDYCAGVDSHYRFFSMGMSADSDGISWKYNSLLQAISIIHALNKSALLHNAWRVCPICRELFEPDDSRQIYCKNGNCKDTAAHRRYRSKRKERE